MSTQTFPAARTVADLPFAAAAGYPDRTAFRFRRDGGWQDRSFPELAETVTALALGLVEAGVMPGDRICVLAETRPEWSYAGLAVLASGAVLVPIYPTSSAGECEWVVGDSGARMVICEDPAQLAKIERIRGALPDPVETVVMSTGGLDSLMETGRSAGRTDELDRRRRGVDPDDPALIIYTSGTTGPPKGCVLTHRNWLNLCAVNDELSYITGEDVVYLFLPLAHVFAQMVQFACLHAGGTLVFFGGDPSRIVPELAEARPTFLPSVPRVFEKLYTLVTAGLEPERLDQAVRVGLEVRRLRREGTAVPPEVMSSFDALDEALFGKVRAIFGGRLRMALSGAAPISPAVLAFFHAAGVPVLEGYGMTETSGIGAVNTLDRFRLGKVGVASPGVRLRVAEDGEVLMKGPQLFAGYWRDPTATADTIVDGWLHTGDLGEIDADGFLAITGRKKDLIITAGGKNIAPANFENELRQSRWISHAVMYGDARPYPVALVTLDADEILPWARQHGLPGDLSALVTQPRVRELIQGVLDEVNAGHSRAEQIKRFAILDRDLSHEAGELTPTLKVKRTVVHTNHAEVIADLYETG